MYDGGVSGVGAAGGERRTQAERRAATRGALLDATAECLVEEGYANTTTRGIARRAGVTPGALQHHFATKERLIYEALQHLAGKVVQELLARGLPAGPSLRERLEQATDDVWELHQGPIVQTGLELVVVARTDPVLRGAVRKFVGDLGSWTELVTSQLFGELARQPGFAELIATGIAGIRGLAILRFTGDDETVDRVWPVMRAQLIDNFFQFVRASGVSS